MVTTGMTHNNPITIRPATENDIGAIGVVLSDWLSEYEVRHYCDQILDSASNPTAPNYDAHYFTASVKDTIIGVAGCRQPLPKLLRFTATAKPAELCVLYVRNIHRGGKGIGTSLLSAVIDHVKQQGYTELVVRSAERFIDTGWGFYDHKGFRRVGELLPPESETTSQIWSKTL